MTRCVRCKTAAATHEPCCSAHRLDHCCHCYRRTHFVEVRPCCGSDRRALEREAAAS